MRGRRGRRADPQPGHRTLRGSLAHQGRGARVQADIRGHRRRRDGVEVASEIHTLVHENLAPDYLNIDPHRVRIILLEGLPNILPELDPALRKAARARMVNQRIEVRTNAMAEEITENAWKLKGGSTIDSENVIWTAGNRPNLGIEAPGLPVDERTGIKVDEFLRVEGHENVWAIGDCAAVQDVRAEQDGKIVPPTAQAAVQEGHVVARNILAAIDGKAT